MKKQEQTINFFNKLAPQWDTMVKKDQEKINTLFNLIQLKENSKVLDIGTGTGILLPEILKTNPRELVAIDISDEMIKVAQNKEENNGTKFIVGDFCEFEDSGYDLLICYQAYPHFEDKAKFIKNLSNCLIPGGRFVIFHPDSKEIINNRHKGEEVSKLSDSLHCAYDEANRFAKFFNIDMLLDTDDFYMISGTKKALPE